MALELGHIDMIANGKKKTIQYIIYMTRLVCNLYTVSHVFNTYSRIHTSRSKRSYYGYMLL